MVQYGQPQHGSRGYHDPDRQWKKQGTVLGCQFSEPAKFNEAFTSLKEAKASHYLSTFWRITSSCRQWEQVSCSVSLLVLLQVGCFLCLHQQEQVSCQVRLQVLWSP